MSRTKTSSGPLPREDQLTLHLLEPAGPLRWQDLFANEHPVEVEVGSGKGLFLANAASQSPKRNFLGIEVSRKYARFCAGKLAAQALSNARVLHADARIVISQWIADRSVAVVHVYFPDPWWKRRHKKRRLMNGEFVSEIARVLEPQGLLRIASDVEEYFAQIQLLISRNPDFRLVQSLPVQGPSPENVTNFERKYRGSGRSVYKAVYQWSPGTSGERTA